MSLTRVSAGVPTGGQFAATHHAEPALCLVEGVDRFPHPDRKYPHPMQCWPEGVEHPASITAGTGDVQTGFSADPQDHVYSDLPRVVITMANNASLTVQQLTDNDFPEIEATLKGDWSEYTGDDKFTADSILDTAPETLSQLGK